MKPYVLIRPRQSTACFPIEVSAGSNHPSGNIRRKMSDLSDLATGLHAKATGRLTKAASFRQSSERSMASPFPDRHDSLVHLKPRASTEPVLPLKIRSSLLGRPAHRLKFTSAPSAEDIKKPKPLYPGGPIYIAPSKGGFLFPK
jgi:hypothetical protein